MSGYALTAWSFFELGVGSVEAGVLSYCNHDTLAFNHLKDQCSGSSNGILRIMECVVWEQRNPDSMKHCSCTCRKISLREIYAASHTYTTHILKLQQVIPGAYIGRMPMLFTLSRVVDNSPFERSFWSAFELLWVVELWVNLSFNASHLWHLDFLFTKIHLGVYPCRCRGLNVSKIHTYYTYIIHTWSTKGDIQKHQNTVCSYISHCKHIP